MVAAGLGRYAAESLRTVADALAAVELALELGADVNAATDAGHTALHAAAHIKSDRLGSAARGSRRRGQRRERARGDAVDARRPLPGRQRQRPGPHEHRGSAARPRRRGAARAATRRPAIAPTRAPAGHHPSKLVSPAPRWNHRTSHGDSLFTMASRLRDAQRHRQQRSARRWRCRMCSQSAAWRQRSTISRTSDDRHGKSLSDNRRFAPTSAHLRNPGSASAECAGRVG